MPQIGWLEILSIVIIAILVLGPKEFPIALKKIGSYFGKLKNTISSFQREVNSATENIDIEKDIAKENSNKEDKNKKVRRIHTGFNGPATGDNYYNFKKDFEDFLEKVIAE